MSLVITFFLTFFFVFFPLMGICKECYDDSNRISEEDLKDCILTEESHLKLSSKEIKNGKAKLQQGNFGGCYLVSILTVMQYEINQKRIAKGEKPITLSLSNAFCKGSKYKDGGLPISVFLNIMLGDRKLCLKKDEVISHREVVDYLNDGHPNQCTTERDSLSVLHNEIQGIMQNGETTTRNSKIAEAILDAQNSFCSERFELPPMKMIHKEETDPEIAFNDIKQEIKKGRMVNFIINGHATNAIGFYEYQCKGDKYPLRVISILDPNGFSVDFKADCYLDQLVKNYGIFIVEVRDEPIAALDLLESKKKFFYFISFVKQENEDIIFRLTDEILKTNKEDINQTIQDDTTPLFLAAQNGHFDIVKYLVEKGANKDLATKDGGTPLLIAAEKGHFDIVKYLVDKGANKDLAREDGITPLFIAAQEGHLNIVKYLVDKGANKDLAEEGGATPLMTAAQNGCLDIVEYLLAQKPIQLEAKLTGDVVHKDYLGATALFIAVGFNQIDVAKSLIKAGADINTQNASGLSLVKFLKKLYHSPEGNKYHELYRYIQNQQSRKRKFQRL